MSGEHKAKSNNITTLNCQEFKGHKQLPVVSAHPRKRVSRGNIYPDLCTECKVHIFYVGLGLVIQQSSLWSCCSVVLNPWVS